jgi:hypothetical protein
MQIQSPQRRLRHQSTASSIRQYGSALRLSAAIADDGPRQRWQPVAMTTRLTHSFSGALRTFSHCVANGTLGQPVLDGTDYSFVPSDEPSALERIYATFANVIEMDDVGNVLNAKYAERRAKQWLRSYIEPAYNVVPIRRPGSTPVQPPPREHPATS